jgi:hypothetical protein
VYVNRYYGTELRPGSVLRSPIVRASESAERQTRSVRNGETVTHLVEVAIPNLGKGAAMTKIPGDDWPELIRKNLCPPE